MCSRAPHVDHLVGGNGTDILLGLGAHDNLEGLRGPDYIDAGPGPTGFSAAPAMTKSTVESVAAATVSGEWPVATASTAETATIVSMETAALASSILGRHRIYLLGEATTTASTPEMASRIASAVGQVLIAP
jgi:hypothetical protein